MLAISGYTIGPPLSEERGVVTYAATRILDSTPVVLRHAPLGTEENSVRNVARDYSMSRTVGSIALEAIEEIREDNGGVIAVFNQTSCRPLREMVDRGALTVGSFLPAAIAIVDAVSELHKQSVIHKNLNVDSIYYDEVNRTAQLGHFGIASHTPHDGVLSLSKLEGSPAYISPEQTGRVNRSVDQRTDCYALGVVFYRMLTGRLPFQSIDTLELIHAHLAVKPAPVSQLMSDVPEMLSVIIDKMLAKTPDARYQRLSALAADLKNCSEQWSRKRDISLFTPGQSDTYNTLNIPQALYGRETELAVLESALERTIAGENQLVLVSGEPGVGKTALVQEVREPVAINSGYFISGKFDQYKRNIPYSAIIDAFRNLVREILGEPDTELQRWRQQLLDSLGDQAQIVIDVIPEVELVIGPQPAVPELPPVEGRNRFVRVFRDFARVFARPGRPLALFLDDMQWTDSASLSFLEDLLTDATPVPILLICAYRNTELEAAHPFAQLLTGIDEIIAAQRIQVQPLAVNHVRQLVASTLSCAPGDSQALADLVFAKTSGNPFFINQFLQFLAAESLVTFSELDARWIWNLEEINERGASGSVVELMSAKISRLSPLAQDALKVAAAISNSFNLATLALASGLDIVDLRKAAREALREGILLTRTDGYSLADETRHVRVDIADTAELRFLHDRVQQAAHALIPEEERESLSLNIGRILLTQWERSGDEELPFDVVNHLNTGRRLLTEPAERIRLARLNVQAAHRARSSIAFTDALEYLEIADELLTEEVWQNDHALAFEMNMERLECEYQAGNADNADRMFNGLLEKLSDPLERAKVYYTKILVETSRDRNDEAIRLGIRALTEFGVRIPAKPGNASLTSLMLKVRFKVRRKSTVELAALPPITDPEIRTVMQLLMSICPAAYFSNPNVMTYAALKIVDLTQSHGNGPSSAYGYVLYALVLGAVFGDYENGHAFGALALELSRRDADPLLHCKVSFIFSGLVNFWRRSAESSIQGIREAYKASLDAGDMQYATYSLQFIIQYLMFRGTPLDELQEECTSHESFTNQTKDLITIHTLAFRQHYVRQLRDINSSYDIEESLARDRNSENATSLVYQLVPLMQLAYLQGDYQLAADYAAEAERNLTGVLSQPVETDFHLFNALNAAARLRGSRRGHATLKRTLRRSLKQFRKWSANQHENFSQQAALLSAEQAALDGNGEEAQRLYATAAVTAEENGFLHIAAVANELAARHLFKTDQPRKAREALDCAHRKYQQWGATAKVRQLEDEFGALITTSPAEQPAAATSAEQRLDFDSVLKASQAVATDVRPESLLERLLAISLENVGGTYGCMILVANDTLSVSATTTAGQVHLMAPGETTLSASTIEPMVRFVARTREDVVIDDVTRDPRFTSHARVDSANVRSALCTPILLKNQAVGVLYFENSLVTGAFTPDRLQTLRMIASEVANALGSAHLQRELSEHSESLSAALDRVENLQNTSNQLSKFVPQSVRRMIEQNPENPGLEKQDRDVSVLFLDVEGYTRLSQELDANAMNRIIEHYFSSYLEDIHENGGDINETLGDGLMIIFQDDDPLLHATKACRAAMAIIAKTTEINDQKPVDQPAIMVNIGINSGTASVGSTRLEGGSGIRYTYTASGAVTNMAARIGAIAENGAVFISGDTAGRLDEEFTVVSAGRHNLKNIAEPVEVFRLLLE